MEWLSIGSIVKLNNGSKNLMIACRTPLFQSGETIGYYDYGAYLFPEGQISSDMFYFNSEDIAEVIFKGYCDDSEELLRKYINEKRNEIPYPKLTVGDTL